VRVKGKDVPITIYEPMGYVDSLSDPEKERIARWNDFIELYRSQDWDRAEASLSELIEGEPDCFLYEVYAERIIAMRTSPPGPNWDGVTKYDSK
jgi:adenylate cyclase